MIELGKFVGHSRNKKLIFFSRASLNLPNWPKLFIKWPI